jgi:hypothetical protein
MLPRVPQSQPSWSRLARTISWKRWMSAAGHVQLEDERAGEDRQKPVGEGAGGQAERIADGEGERSPGAADERFQVLLELEPGSVDEGTDELKKAGGRSQLRRHGKGLDRPS